MLLISRDRDCRTSTSYRLAAKRSSSIDTTLMPFTMAKAFFEVSRVKVTTKGEEETLTEYFLRMKAWMDQINTD